MKNVMQFILSMTSLLFSGYGDFEPGYEGYPNYQERIIHVWTNICRTSPTTFRDSLIVPVCSGSQNILNAYPAVAPLYWNINLNRASRFHSRDLADYNFFSHKSHDSTTALDRVTSYFPGISWYGENIAAGNSRSLATFRQWIIETKDCPPAVDGSGDGHRSNIMLVYFNQIGVGYAYTDNDSSYHYYWTQDFAGNASAYADRRLVSGSHDFSLSTNKTSYLLNYYDASGKTPTTKTVVVDGVSRGMALWMGTASRGTYRLDLATGRVCRNYYFAFTDGDGLSCRYPEEGVLVTYGEGTCSKDYLPPESLSVEVSRPSSSGISQQVSGQSLFIRAFSPEFIPLKTEIVDILGRRVISIKWGLSSESELVLPLPGNLSAGVYIARHSLPNGAVKSIRFVQVD